MTPPPGTKASTVRADAAARTRQALIEAGLRLAGQTSLHALRVDRIVEEAGVSKGTFFHHFGDRQSFVNDLLRDFYDRLAATVTEVMATDQPGAARILNATNAYLDGCAANPGARALLLEARTDPRVSAEIIDRNLMFARLIAEDFTAMDRANPVECGQLWVGTTAEAACLEHHAGTPLPRIRAALAESLTTPGGTRHD